MIKAKKVLLLALSFALVAAISIAGTMAYFTSTDSKANVMTTGNVQIKLIEQQRNEDGTALEEFEQTKTLMPIVGSAQGEKDKFGLSTAANYVDKIVSVENTGKSDAYVRVLVAVPAALEGESGTSNANALHWNLGNRFDRDGESKYNTVSRTDIPTLKENGTTIIGGVKYNLYSFTYEEAIKPNTITDAAAFVGFYLDSKVDFDGKNYTLDGKVIDYDFSNGVIIPVMAQGVQADGFATADAAFTAAKLTIDPWGNNNSKDAGLVFAKPTSGATRPAGYNPIEEGTNNVEGITVIDKSDENTNLRALYTGDGKKVEGDLAVVDCYLDGTYAMNVIGNDTGALTVNDTDLRGWVSYDGFTTATFTNCTFGENTNPEIYNTVRPYSTVTFENCEFDGTDFWLDKVSNDEKVIFKNCTIDGTAITSVDQLTVVYGTTDCVEIQ